MYHVMMLKAMCREDKSELGMYSVRERLENQVIFEFQVLLYRELYLLLSYLYVLRVKVSLSLVSFRLLHKHPVGY